METKLINGLMVFENWNVNFNNAEVYWKIDDDKNVDFRVCDKLVISSLYSIKLSHLIDWNWTDLLSLFLFS